MSYAEDFRRFSPMPLNLRYDDPCSKCGMLAMQSVIERHPSRRDVAIQSFYCADCGPVKTRDISLKPGKPSSELAA
jgi:hypothetical protein